MRYPALITHEGKATLALFRFADGTECATFADEGEDMAAQAREALEGRVESYLSEGDSPPLPPRHAPKGEVLWIDLPSRLAAKVAIRAARDAANLTQGELAARAHVSQQQIAKWENPKTDPGLDSLDKMASVLGIVIDFSEARGFRVAKRASGTAGPVRAYAAASKPKSPKPQSKRYR